MPSKTYRKLLAEGESFLCEQGIEDYSFDARCLLEWISGLDRSGLVMRYHEPVSDEVDVKFRRALSQRAEGTPLQYILGEWDFMGHTFWVEKGVLIPRPETEFLAEWVIEHLPRNGVVYDVCSGTGCIGLSIAIARPDATVFLFDKYKAPLHCTERNIQKFHVENAHCISRDLFEGIPQNLPLPDVIVSNPPYIPSVFLSSLQKEVQQEPMEALDGGEDGLIFYRALQKLWFPSVQLGGFMALECGEDQAKIIASFFQGNTSLHNDYIGTERFIIAYQ